MKAFLVLANALQQGANLAGAPPLAPLRKDRAQVQPEDARRAARRHDLKERMFRARRVVPLVMRDLDAADVADGMRPAGGPERRAGGFGDCFDDARVNRFLKDHQVGRDLADRRRELRPAPAPAEPNVVTEQPERHDFSSASMMTKYGSSRSTSRANKMMFDVA